MLILLLAILLLLSSPSLLGNVFSRISLHFFIGLLSKAWLHCYYYTWCHDEKVVIDNLATITNLKGGAAERFFRLKIVQSCPKQHQKTMLEIASLAYLHDWRDMAVPPDKPHRRCTPNLEDVSRLLAQTAKHLVDLSVACRV